MCPDNCQFEKMLRVLVTFIEKGDLPNYEHIDCYQLTAALADAHLVLNNEPMKWYKEKP